MKSLQNGKRSNALARGIERGWADKELKKHKIRKLVEQAMRDPKYEEERKEMFYDYYVRSLNAFLLISVDFLHRKLGFGQKRVMKFLEFALEQLDFIHEDEDYFKLLNQELEKEVGVNVLGEMTKGEKHDGKTNSLE